MPIRRVPRSKKQPQAGAFWALPADRVLQNLSSSAAGLGAADAAERQRRFGANAIPAGNGSTAWRLALRQFANPLVLLLVGAAGLSWLLHEHDDALIILAIVGVSSAAGFRQELSAGNAVKALMRLVAVKAMVRRDGVDASVPVEALVPGDVVQLAAGSLVPADLRVLESQTLYVDEAALTGESFPSEKSADVSAPDAPVAARRAALYSGTHVVSGTATAVVVATGPATAFAQVIRELARTRPVPGFERGLQQFGALLVRVTLLLVVAVFAITMQRHQDVLGALMFALAISVGITPELLPAIVTVNLARGARRMAARRVIVKRLDAIENLGSMTVLCADKTGTLTEGIVTLAGAWSPDGRDDASVLELAAINAGLQAGLPSPIDDAIRTTSPLARGDWTKLDEVPYDFHRRRLSVLVEARDGRRLLVTKGALASVLGCCTRARCSTGEVPLDEVRDGIQAFHRARSAEGLRLLGVAERAAGGATHARIDDETGLVFRGFVALSDAPKAGIGATIARLREAGVRLKVITGDNRNVAAAMASRVGLDATRLLGGDEIRRLDPVALAVRAVDTDVFAEVEPNQKEQILAALRRAGETVGFLGDGINDAPALHSADVGISVDSAVDVAKDAAAIVLLDHDLDVLAEGIAEGRQTFENTMKYIRITTSANFGNMLSMAVAVPFLPFLPMLPAQILLNNFLSDVPAVTIAGDRVDAQAVAAPGHWDLPTIRNFMLVFGSISSLFDLLTFGVLRHVLHAGAAEFRSAWFLESLLTEIAVLLVMRTRLPVLGSRPSRALVAASGGAAAAALGLLYVPALAAPMEFVALRPALLATVLAITGGYALVSEQAKLRFFGRPGQAPAPGIGVSAPDRKIP